MQKKKILKILNFLIFGLILVNFIIMAWLHNDFNAIGTENFDLSKWLDADIWIINSILFPSICFNVLFCILYIIIYKKK